MMAAATTKNIEVIDFNDFLSGGDTDRKAVANAFLESFKTIGFVCLTNHGLPQPKVNEMFNWVCYICS